MEERIWTSRKFISAWALTLLCTGLLIFKNLTPESYASIISWVWMGYFASNVGSKLVIKSKEQ